MNLTVIGRTRFPSPPRRTVSAGQPVQLAEIARPPVEPAGVGNAYQALYAGINYLIFGDHFKVMAGAEYSVMNDAATGHDSFAGWTYLAGVGVYF